MEREYRPDGEQFAERSASDQAFAIGSPIDLAGNIKVLVQQEQAHHSKEFNPASWLRTNMGVIFAEAIQQEQPEETQTFFYALRATWDLVAYRELDGEHSESVYRDIAGCIDVFESTTLTLSQLGVTLLDAMAEALDIPHISGQAEFDISLFSEAAISRRIRQGVLYSSPSLDEVRRAIAPKESETSQ